MKRGVSPLISYVLIVAVVITTASAAYLWAYPHMQKLGEGAKAKSLENQVRSLDYAVRQAANGEVGFVNYFHLYKPDGYIRVNEGDDTIAFTFRQKVEAVPNIEEPEGMDLNTTCTENSTYIKDNVTGLVLKRDSSNPYIYKGSTGEGGSAEILLCYPNVNLTWKGNCIRGTSSSRTSVVIEKENITADGRKIVSIDFC